MLGSFENHVLNEMRNAVPLQVFIARAGLDPDTNGDRADMLHLLGQNNQTVRENSRWILRFSSTIFLANDCGEEFLP